MNNILAGGPSVSVKCPQKYYQKTGPNEHIRQGTHGVVSCWSWGGYQIFFLCQGFKMFTWVTLRKVDCRDVRIKTGRTVIVPWLIWLSALSVDLWTKGLPVRFPVRAHAWIVGQVLQLGACERQPHIDDSPTLFLPPFPSL